MKLIYKKISREYYNDNKSNISKLIEDIWQKNIDDVEMAKKAIERSFTTEKGSFYYIIEKDGKDIGLTGYYTIDDNTKIFGLNHHGILKKYRGKGLGKKTLKDLINIIKKYHKNFEGIIELVPKNNLEIEKIFKSMGFTDYTKESLGLKFINDIIKKGYYSKVYILKDN